MWLRCYRFIYVQPFAGGVGVESVDGDDLWPIQGCLGMLIVIVIFITAPIHMVHAAEIKVRTRRSGQSSNPVSVSLQRATNVSDSW